MAYIGFQKPKYCPYTVTTDADGNEVETYGEVKTFAKGINLNASYNTAKAKLHADDGVAEQCNEFISGSMTVGIDDLDNEVDADISGAKIDENGDITDTDTDTPAYLRFGYIVRRFKGNQSQYRALIYPRIMFDLSPDDYETKGESLVFKTPVLTAEIMRNYIGEWRKRSGWKNTLAEANTWLDTNLKPKTTA